MDERATKQCPICGAKMRPGQSRMVGSVFRERRYRCSNAACGFACKAIIEPAKVLSVAAVKTRRAVVRNRKSD